MKLSIQFLIFLFASTSILAQTSVADISTKVMLIGEEESYYEELVGECNNLLLNVTGNSMEEAFGSWTSMLEEMEAAASTEGFDIKGVKLWINLFWNEDGTIRRIFYYPKPTSKNMDFEQLTTFFESFAASYVFPINGDACFSHYGSASFPVRARRVATVEK